MFISQPPFFFGETLLCYLCPSISWGLSLILLLQLGSGIPLLFHSPDLCEDRSPGAAVTCGGCRNTPPWVLAQPCSFAEHRFHRHQQEWRKEGMRSRCPAPLLHQLTSMAGDHSRREKLETLVFNLSQHLRAMILPQWPCPYVHPDSQAVTTSALSPIN